MITSHSLPARLAVLAAFVAGATPAMAQDKTDGLWRGTGGAALSVTSGNSSTSSLLLSADAVKATTADKVTLGAMTNYAKNKTGGVNQTTANKWGAFGQYDFNLTPRLFAFGRLGLDGDALIDLNLRTGVAAGLGYKLIDTQEASFEVFGGVGYTTDRYGSPQTIGGKTDTRFSRGISSSFCAFSWMAAASSSGRNCQRSWACEPANDIAVSRSVCWRRSSG